MLKSHNYHINCRFDTKAALRLNSSLRMCLPQNMTIPGRFNVCMHFLPTENFHHACSLCHISIKWRHKEKKPTKLRIPLTEMKSSKSSASFCDVLKLADFTRNQQRSKCWSNWYFITDGFDQFQPQINMKITLFTQFGANLFVDAITNTVLFISAVLRSGSGNLFVVSELVVFFSIRSMYSNAIVFYQFLSIKWFFICAFKVKLWHVLMSSTFPSKKQETFFIVYLTTATSQQSG